MVTCYIICRDKNDYYYHKEREGGGQKVMIEIIISENDDNDGRPLTREREFVQHENPKHLATGNS